jgi:hypothetical protein
MQQPGVHPPTTTGVALPASLRLGSWLGSAPPGAILAVRADAMCAHPAAAAIRSKLRMWQVAGVCRRHVRAVCFISLSMLSC